ncbi:MAG: 50S ribosomal protein L24 [Candidatus Kariarchaeaceae archaeon]
MRTKSKKPKKQRRYQFNIGKNEVHKAMTANLSVELRERKGFRSLPVRVGDTVLITRGGMKSRSGKVMKVDPKRQRVFVDKIVKRKTDNTEVPVPIHPSNLVITKYQERDRKRLELINRRIKDVAEKIDIDAVMASAEDEDEDILDIDDETMLDDLELLDELDTLEDDDDDDIELVEAGEESSETAEEKEETE